MTILKNNKIIILDNLSLSNQHLLLLLFNIKIDLE